MRRRLVPRALAVGATAAVVALVAALMATVSAAGAQSQGPVGYVDSVSADGTTVTVTGWAADPASPDRDVLVDAFVDGSYVETAVTNINRGDVVAAFPSYNTTSGFAMDFGVSAGSHEVCIYATDLDALNTLLGCRTITASADNVRPVGYLDAASVDGTTVTVTGWAADPAMPDRDVLVDIFVNGNYTETTPTDVNRGDVEAAFPEYGSETGFMESFGAPAGEHTVCAYAIDQNSLNTLLGCRTVTVQGSDPVMPVGSLDGVSVDGTTVTVGGWAADPGMPERDVNVDVFVDGSYAATTTTDDPRPDVESAFPAYGSTTGFNTSFGVAPGGHQVCAYAIDESALNTLLGCQVVTAVGDPSVMPVGNVDLIAAADGGVRVAGWAADPAMPERDVNVDVFVDGIYAETTPTDGQRPDVAAAFPTYGDTTGFDVVFDTAAGTHTVCAYAIDQDALNTRLGCAIVTVS